MKKKWCKDEKFGEIPFEKIKKAIVEFEGLNSIKDAAFLQYNLLLEEGIIDVGIDFGSKKGILFFNPMELKKENLLKKIKKPFKAKLIKVEEFNYIELLKNSFQI